MNMVKLGWKAAPEQHPPRDLVECSVIAEKAGFDSIDASDHFHPWSEDGQASFTWAWLGAAAVQTRKIELGTGLTCPILRYHPAIVAQAAATIGSLAPRRAYLSVGTGEALNEYAVVSQWPGHDERQLMMQEAIELIRTLWSGEKVSFGGIYYTTRKAKLYTLPDKPIPLYISALVPSSAEFAGRHGDGLITAGGKKPEEYKKILENFDAGAREAGKDPSKMSKLVELWTEYTDDTKRAVEFMKKYWAGSFVPALYNQKIYTPEMSEENGMAVGSDTILQQSCISSKAEDHVEFARKYIDLGFTHIYFHSASPDQKSFLEWYGKDVLPKIRESAGS